MKLESLNFEVRHRSHWEALDLGTLLAKRWYGRLLVCWLLLAAPVFCIVFVLLFNHPFWAIFIVWWLKPLYERVPLLFLSTSVFGEVPTNRQVVNNFKRALNQGLIRTLTIRRFSPVRSFEAPVVLLEGVDGDTRHKRIGILQNKAGSAGIWLTIFGMHIEAFLVLGMVAMVYWLIPSEVEIDWQSVILEGSESIQGWLSNLFTFLAMALVAPFYISCGFALYLNRRIELEAWDIEIGFRKLAARAQAAMVIACLALLPTVDLSALEAPAEPAPTLPIVEGLDSTDGSLSSRRQESRLAIEKILAGDAFHERTSLRYPEILDWLFESEQEQDAGDLSWLLAAMPALATIVEVVLWLFFAFALLWLGYRSRLFERITSRSIGVRPKEIRGLAVSEESLPEDVAKTALSLWDNGQEREAVSLFYRASLARLMTSFQCRFRESDTEGDCLLRAREQAPQRVIDYFTELTRVWLLAAYAHQLPADAVFQQLRARWTTLFRIPSDGTG